MKIFSKSPSEKELLMTIAQNQVLLSKKMENIEKRLDKMDKRQTQGFADTIKGLFILYGKAVMARLNFIELSEGKPISASANEWREIKNSQSPRPNPNILILPIDGQVGEENEAFKKTRKSKLN
jgi:hypothetical protein